MDKDKPTAFDYLLNAMENAGSEGDPSGHLYYDKRMAVLDHVATLTARCAELEKVLTELVACKDLKDSIDKEVTATTRWRDGNDEYQRRKPLAWEAARTVITKEPSNGQG